MAYMRTLATRTSSLIKRHHYPPSSFLNYILHTTNDDDHQNPKHGPKTNPLPNNNHHLSTYATRCGFNLFSSNAMGVSILRHMSTSVGGGGSENVEVISDVAEVLSDAAATTSVVEGVASQAPVVNEVAVVAADSFLPVQMLQHFIDNVHTFAGVNWWVAIALSTILIRTATVPLLINQLKSTTKLTLLRPHLEAIKEEMQDKGRDPQAVAEGQKRMNELFKEYGVNPFTPLKGLFIQGPVFVCFFLAISNMAEKVASFKTGGAYWFTDLSTPDALYIFPVLAALSILLTVECNMQEGLEGNPAAATIKTFSRIFAIASIPLTMGIPKAIFCYWITSNMFSLAYGMVLKVPGVKKSLGVPEIPLTPPTKNDPQSTFNLFSALKQATAAKQETAAPPKNDAAPADLSDYKISSSSVLSQRIRSLEKQVKGRNKIKKRHNVKIRAMKDGSH